jgi:hypothetical protein
MSNVVQFPAPVEISVGEDGKDILRFTVTGQKLRPEEEAQIRSLHKAANGAYQVLIELEKRGEPMPEVLHGYALAMGVFASVNCPEACYPQFIGMLAESLKVRGQKP